MTARRALFPGDLVHLTDKGTRDEALFTHPGDHEFWLDRLGEASERTGLEVLHFCLMSNHTHLVARDPHGELSDALWQLKTKFANRRRYVHRLPGTTFARRFHGKPIRDQRYFENAMVYLSANPVKAGMCAERSEHRWSAHRALVGEATAPSWLAVGLAHGLLGGPVACADLLSDTTRDGALPPPNRGGRPTSIDPCVVRAIVAEGLSYRAAAERLGVGLGTIARAMAKRSET